MCEPILSEICSDHDAYIHNVCVYDVSLAHAVLIASTTLCNFSSPRRVRVSYSQRYAGAAVSTIAPGWVQCILA